MITSCRIIQRNLIGLQKYLCQWGHCKIHFLVATPPPVRFFSHYSFGAIMYTLWHQIMHLFLIERVANINLAKKTGLENKIVAVVTKETNSTTLYEIYQLCTFLKALLDGYKPCKGGNTNCTIVHYHSKCNFYFCRVYL